MNQYFLYARKSTDTEDKQVLSIESQLAELRAFALQYELAIVDELVEKQSAKIPGRPIFNEMLARIEHKEATGILAWHPDRLARNSIDGGRIIHLIDTGALCALKFPQFWFEPTPQGKFMLNIAFGQSKYYVDSLAENTKRGLRQKVRRGEYPGLAPVGYLNDKQSKSVIIDPERGPIIRRAFELYAQNNSTFQDISDFLAQHGVRRKSGKRQHLDQISFLLRNPMYYGHFRYSGEVHEGKHSPIISKKLFDQTQAVLEQRSRPHYKSKNAAPSLCGLLSCESCGMSITGERKIKRNKKGLEHRYTYYRCTKKRKDMICPEPCIREEQLDRQLSDLLRTVSLSADGAQILRQLLAQDETDSAQSVATFAQGARAQIEQIDLTLQRLLDGYLARDIERDDYRARKDKLTADKKSLQEQIARLTKRHTGWLELLRQWIKDAESFEKIAATNDLQSKKTAAQKSFGSHLFLSQRTLVHKAPQAPDFSMQNAWAALRAAHLDTAETDFYRKMVAGARYVEWLNAIVVPLKVRLVA